MRGEVTLRDRRVTYELVRKAVKNINLRVRADGTVAVSAPRAVPQAYVEDLLRQRAAFICRALDHFQELERRAPRDPAFGEGERVYLLGRPYRLCLRPGTGAAVTQGQETLTLTLRDPDDPEARKRAVRDYQRACCLAVTTDLIRQARPRMEALGIPMPEIKVRSMTSRWGSCRPSARRVTFAVQLIEAPLPCVEYVVWHELTHFRHPDHSPAFYADLAAVLPDWKARRELLNSYRYREL